MSSALLTTQLTPPSSLKNDMHLFSQSGHSLACLIDQMGQSKEMADVPPPVRTLFLNNLEPYSKYLGEEGLGYIGQMNTLSEDILQLAHKMQQLASFLANNLDRLNEAGFHPLFHYLVKHKFQSALDKLQTVKANSQGLVAGLNSYHKELNTYVGKLNDEINTLKLGPQFVANEYNNLMAYMSKLYVYDYWAYLRRYWMAASTANHELLQYGYLQNPTFNIIVKKLIYRILDEFKTQSSQTVDAVERLSDSWSVIEGGLGTTVNAIQTLSRDFPKTIQILQKIHLKDLNQDWAEVIQQVNTAEQTLAGGR